MSGNSKKIIAFNYFGGKFTWLEHLYDHFPHDYIHLADGFGGSFAVTLNCPGNVVKTANEINSSITNFFQVLRDHEAELIHLLELTPCSKEEYNRCWEHHPDKIEEARRFYVRVRQSIFALGAGKKSKGWQMAKEKCNANGGETVSKWNNAIPKLHPVAKLLRRNLQITNYDIFKFIDVVDFSKVLHYWDPPYVESTRKSKNDYKHEFSLDKHYQLAERAHTVEGYCMISGYPSKLYDEELYADFTSVEFPSKMNNIRSGMVTEKIWFNYPFEKTVKYQRQQHQKKYGTPVLLNL